MDLKSFALYAVVALVSAGLAIFTFGGNEPPKEQKQEFLERIDDPIWYRFASYETRRVALKKDLALMTSRSIAPEQTGIIKDEIALLCRDERLVDDVVDSFNSHPRLTPALLSAYMEICGRVKSKKLAPLLERGFKSSDFDVRLNAADAGILHEDVRSVEEMGVAMQVTSGAEAKRILFSLIGVGGNEALGQIENVLEREEPELLVLAIRALGDAKHVGAIERVRTRLQHPSPNVVMAAAGFLASMGQQDGYQFLLELAGNPNSDPLERAESIQMLYTISGKKHKDLYQRLSKRDDIIGFESRLNLLKLRDEATLKSIHKDVLEGNSHQRTAAVGSLGASGHPDDVEFLIRHIEDMGAAMYNAMLQSLKRGKAPNATKALAALAALEKPESYMAFREFPQFGEAGLDDVVAVLNQELNPEKRDILLRAIASVPSPKSIEILQSIKPGKDRDLWLLVRSLIRKVDLGLLKK